MHAQRRRSAPAAAPGAEAAHARAAGTGRVEPEASLADELAGLSPRSAASDDVPGRSPRRYADEDDDEVLAGAGSGLRAGDLSDRRRSGAGGAARPSNGAAAGSGASTPNTARAGGGSGDGATPFDASLVRASEAAPTCSEPLTTWALRTSLRSTLQSWCRFTARGSGSGHACALGSIVKVGAVRSASMAATNRITR